MAPVARRDILIAVGLALAIIICYAQVAHYDFVNYDDHRYVTHNPRVQQGLTLDNIGWAFTTFEVANWHPLTWISHMIDAELYPVHGTGAAGGHHLTNVLLHMVNTIALFAALRMMTGTMWRAALVAAIFALHPLRVESVAWISERKDVLSAMFGFLALCAYATYIRKPSLARYVFVAALFACSLMSKPLFVTLPFVLLLLDYWPLRRVQFENKTIDVSRLWRLTLEKLPLFAMSAASSALTLAAQRSGGAISDLAAVSLTSRLTNATVAYFLYLKQMAWPAGLAPLYPLPQEWPVMLIAIAIATLVIISIAAILWWRHKPHFIVGWLWYLGTLVPMIGLVQVGSQSHADRYTYLPMIGVLIMLVWSIPTLQPRIVMRVGVPIVAAMLVTMMAMTWMQTQHWRDSISLSVRTLAVTERNGYAHFNYANALQDAGELNAAIDQFRIAGELLPQWSAPPFNRGNVLSMMNRFDDAVAAYDEAIARDPQAVDAIINQGIAFARSGNIAQAIDSFQRAAAMQPNDPQPLINLGQALQQSGRNDEAINAYRRALQLAPNHAGAHLMLGNMLAMRDQLNEALHHFDQSLRLDPNNPFAHMSMASAIAETGQIQQAMQHLAYAAELARAAGDQSLLNTIAERMNQLRTPPPPSAQP